jgi:hypothetical protein
MVKRTEMKNYPQGYGKIRQAVIEELVKQWIVGRISEEGEIEIPQSWFHDAEQMQADILDAMQHQATKEKSGVTEE